MSATFVEGAVYSPARKSAACPGCATWSPAYKVYPWEHGVCLRRHKCPTCGATFKSTQDDPTYYKVQAA